MEGVAIVLGMVAVGGVILFAMRRYEQSRTQQFEAVAEELGLEFHPTGDPTVMEQVGRLRLFNQGRRRKSSNMLHGRTNDLDIAIFEYRYTTGSGKHQHTHTQTVFALQSPHLQLPDFEIRPEHFFHKIGQAFGYKDIDFDTHPTFSRQFLLRGPDEAAIRATFSPEVLDELETRPGLSIEASRDRLIVYRGGKRIKPAEIRPFMELGFAVYSAFKAAAPAEPEGL